MRDAVIVDAVRTPVGKRNGSLAEIHPADLSAHVLKALVERTGIDPGVVDDVVWGCVGQVGDQANNIGRSGVLAAGWPTSVPATTVDRQCGSSQQALHFAAAGVIAGQYDVAVAGGVESMSRVPMGSSRYTGRPFGQTVLDRFGVEVFNQGVGAEMIAEKWAFSRRELDEFAARSHEKAAAATDSGALVAQIATVPGVLEADEGIRRGTTVETLAGLKTSFKVGGVIHAGNASQISDGAAALLITTPEKAKQLGLTPIAKYTAGAVSGADPIMMLTGPIPATEKLLRRTGLSIDDIGAYEVNEAFAPVPMAWAVELKADHERLNPLGGAIALGHPLGGSGAILMTRLIHHMRDNNIRYGVQTMCEGGGTANATLVELAA